jgi:hypothetical protein
VTFLELGYSWDQRPCGYMTHRPSDWIVDDFTGPLQCGVCHPPAIANVVRRDAPGFEELVIAAIEREVPMLLAPPAPLTVTERGEDAQTGFDDHGWRNATG